MTYFSEEQREKCIEVLAIISKNPHLIDNDNIIKGLISKIYKNGRKRKYKQEHYAVVTTGRYSCYICKIRYKERHDFYRYLCLECAQLNFAKRMQRVNLKNHIAIITGGRAKIGYETALKMLRDGAFVVATTRFPINAAQKYAKEKDFCEWKNRLQIYSLDLLNISATRQFCEYIHNTYPYVSILINNAAQTIQRPREYYRSLDVIEEQGIQQQILEIQKRIAIPEKKSLLLKQEFMLEDNPLFPLGKWNKDGEPLDLRNKNSWILRLHEVELSELLETQLVNSIAPFILINRLKKILLQSPLNKNFIVNVSAMEGQFSRETKTINHPHTNMAKAALNMITRTSAFDFAQDKIYMNSVDTGWVTDENPLPKQRSHFAAPLDVVDGAARIYDAIVANLKQELFYGRFLKDYKSVSW